MIKTGLFALVISGMVFSFVGVAQSGASIFKHHASQIDAVIH